jgi:hypothetical protein
MLKSETSSYTEGMQEQIVHYSSIPYSTVVRSSRSSVHRSFYNGVAMMEFDFIPIGFH